MEDRESARVTLFLRDVKIEGFIFTRSEYSRGRISDTLNREKVKFMAIKNALLYKYEEDTPFDKVDTLFVNKDKILYVQPMKQISDEE